MTKKFFSTTIALAMFVGVFGVLHYANADDDTVTSEATIDNVAPEITASQDDSDTGASPGNPTDVGDSTTWTFTIHDDNNDDMYVVICSTNVFTANAVDNAPTCGGGGSTWATSAKLTPDGSGDKTDTLTRTAIQADAESNDWFLIVCDNNAGGRICNTTSGNTGTLAQGDGTDDSPFAVNHPPVIGTVLSGDSAGGTGTIEPGDTIHWDVVVTDPDTVAGSDLIDLHICSSNAFTPGSGCDVTTYCSDTGVSSAGHAQCDDSAALAPVPTVHGTPTFFVFLEDNQNLEDGGTGGSATYTVVDTPPYHSGGYSVTGVSLTAGTVTAKAYTVTLKDDNGGGDIELAYGSFYVTGTGMTNGQCTSPDDNDCINDSNCALTSVSTNEVTATCDFNVQFCADDSGGSNPDWLFRISADDGTTNSRSLAASTAIEVDPLTALSVILQDEGVKIAYGTVAIEAVSDGDTGTSTDIQNMGNQVFDVILDGTNMEVSGYSQVTSCLVDTDCIESTQQEWDHTLVNFTWGTEVTDDSTGPYNLDLSATGSGKDGNGCLDLEMAQRTSATDTPVDNAIFWKIKIPATQDSGTYSGTNTFATAASGTCTGGYDGSTPDGKDS